MSISSSCKYTSTTLSQNLSAAASAEARHAIAARALQDAATRIFPLLDRLRAEQGEGHDEYQQERQAVLELISFICIPYARSATRYASAIALIEEAGKRSGDPLVKKKLLGYTNQIKSAWKESEQGGPRKASRDAGWLDLKELAETFSFPLSRAMSIVWTLLFCLIFLVFFSVRSGNKAPSAHVAARPSGDGSAAAVDVKPSLPFPPGAGTAAPNRPPESLVAPPRAPEQSRPDMTITPRPEPIPETTQIICRNNRVLVPVTLSYRGRETQAVLVLDTGATVTTIDENVAARLQIRQSDQSEGAATVADGRTVSTYSFTTDFLAVGNKKVTDTPVTILRGTGGNGAEGLLGMNYLKEFKYHIDYKRGVIEWGS